MRSGLVALGAVLVLVALGVAIGAGPLQHGAAAQEKDLARQKALVLRRDHRIEALSTGSDLASAYASSTAPRVVAGTLSNRKVALLTLPGVDVATTDRLAALVHAAGGEVTARVALAPGLLAESNRGLLDALTSQMVTQTSGLSVASGASPYQRLGALLARALGVPTSAHAASGPYDPAAISIVSGLEAAKVIDEAQVSARAALTLVVLPDTVDAKTDPAAATVLTSYAGQLPTVVVGPAASASGKGLLATLRASPTFTAGTVDGVETAVGQVSAVLALAARTRGIQGDYGGAGQVDGAVPPLP